MAKKKVLCFGELLLRVSPATGSNAEKQPVQVYVGGAEANVASALAAWEVPVKYCTALPDNFMSQHMIRYLEYQGIYTSSIIKRGKRIGLYYLDRGADLKGGVAYDREHSSFSELEPGVIDWDSILQDVSWLNLSTISPALNANVAAVCLEAVKAASERGITISIDLNYRNRLWNGSNRNPLDVIPQLVEHCDVIMGNIWSANMMLGTTLHQELIHNRTKEGFLEHAALTSQEIIERFPKCQYVANTFRFDGESSNILYYTSLYSNNNLYISAEYNTKGVIDRSGSGDCFMAGLIYGIYNKHSLQDVVDYATAAAFGKLQEQGDSTWQDQLTVRNAKK